MVLGALYSSTNRINEADDVCLFVEYLQDFWTNVVGVAVSRFARDRVTISLT